MSVSYEQGRRKKRLTEIYFQSVLFLCLSGDSQTARRSGAQVFAERIRAERLVANNPNVEYMGF